MTSPENPRQPSNGNDEYWMAQAIQLAKQAQSIGEVPVGALLVDENNKLITSAHNQPILTHNPIAHAEMMVLELAGEILQNYRLNNTTLYVTLEPCAMCTGALVHARVSRVVFGAYDPKSGACGSVMNLADHASLNHQINITGGVYAEACSNLLKNFFKTRR